MTAPIATTPASTARAATTGVPAPDPLLHQVGQITRAGRHAGQNRLPWSMVLLFLAPALLLYSLFVLYPIAQSLRYSLYDWNGLESLDHFVGLDNFRRAFNDPLFRDAVRHNAIIVLLSLALQIPCALGLAVLLNARLPGRALLRTLFFAPYVLSEVVTGVVWRQILRPDGLLDHILNGIGADGLVHEWLADPKVVLYSLFFVISWKYFGFHMILLLAGLQQIPKELGEAAAIDGASAWQTLSSHHPAAARADLAGVDLSLDHRRPPAVRSGLGHDQGRPDRLVLHDGHLSLRPVPQEPVRLRQRGLDRDLRLVADRRPAVPALRPAT